MNRNNRWKFILVIAVVAWSFYSMYPPTPRNLADEFKTQAVKRDATYTNIVERLDKLQKENPDKAYANLLEAIGTNDITGYFAFQTKGELNPTKAVLNRLQREAAGKIKLGLDLQGGTSFLVGVDYSKAAAGTNAVGTNVTSLGEQQKQGMLSQAVEVLRKRVDKFGVAEPVIQPEGDDRILIQLPGLSEADKESARNQIQKAAYLEFRMVHERSDEYTSQGLTEPGYEVLKEKDVLPNGQIQVRPYLVRKKAERGLTGQYVKSAMMTRNQVGQPEIAFELTEQGASIFAEVTRENVGRQLAIVLDGELESAPRINGEIPNGRGVITGSFTEKRAQELANVLENPLQVPVKILSENSVDPTLGKDTVRSGVRSAIIGTLAVAGFMAIYYMLAGMVANVALILNIVILMGIMASVGTTMTLPGIAGIVLTVGMAVDANVLIFERIREESAKGKSLRAALAAGYDRAFGTIFDSHVTTLISSIILIFMGAGPIKGFGVALTIGVAASLFTALVVTRLIFDFLLARGWLKSLPMLHIIRATNIDFMKIGKTAFICTWILIILSLSFGAYRGFKKNDLLGPDFAGGDALTLTFKEKVDVNKVREVVHKDANVKEAMIQYQKDASGGAETLSIKSPYNTAEAVKQALEKEFPKAGFAQAGFSKFGPQIGQEIQQTAVLAGLLSLAGILVYVAFRYEFTFAVGAVAAIIHDVLMTIGIYCLTSLWSEGRQFNATMVAAVLTIIGFSINDTIVIFDRIREDLKLGVRGSFKDIINQALNQTLSRTIITSGTVFLATLSLYIFGGGAINDFAFTFLIGIITGTYSSIYIASFLVLWLHKGERPKIGAPVSVQNAVPAHK